MLTIWCLCKERNSRTFNICPASTVQQVIGKILPKRDLWARAGAKWMGALGWPETSPLA
ncbi:hypothetical protein HU200_023404 [Digitaria exilis]|uniref:Uncharacterized protein n=1 Tax=Digitaria exilis TaxID=1010633 RepID=A0A835C1H2_9POAL|nr:hypothetical protein HU200_023404 [Digitaria exilis]